VSAIATPISPELALVCPELRRQWAAALPDIDPDALFRSDRIARPTPAAAAPAERPVPFLLAAATYALSSFAASLLQGVVTLTVVAVVALILTLSG